MKKLLLMLFGMLAALQVGARDFYYTYEGQTLEYTVIDEDAKTVMVKGPEHGILDVKSLMLPETVYDSGDRVTYTLTEIGNYAFSGCTSLTSVTIPEHVTSIGVEAFENTGLQWLIIPESVKFIGRNAFSSCQNLFSVMILTKDCDFASNCFSNCEFLNKVASYTNYAIDWTSSTVVPWTIEEGETVDAEKGIIWAAGDDGYPWVSGKYTGKLEIPKGVKTLPWTCMSCCPNITEVILPDGLEVIGDQSFFRCSALTTINIPDKVTSIGELAFMECSSLSSVSLPKSLETIAKGAFARTGLTTINIPDKVNSIGESAFQECSSLSSVSLPKSLQTIGEYAFQRCSSLSSVSLPNSLETIEKYAFSITGLTSVVIPNSVTSIGECAFWNCKELKGVIIPPTDIKLGTGVFYECDGLLKSAYPSSMTNPFEWQNHNYGMAIAYDSLDSRVEDDFVYSRRKNKIYYALPTLSGKYEVPETVETISADAFNYCEISSVTFNEALKSIGENAFGNCNLISEVKCKAATPIEAPQNVFERDVYNNATLYVPTNSVKSYESVVPWCYFYDIVGSEFRDVESVTLNEQSLTIMVGETATLVATVLPEDADDKTVTWKSSNEEVATVDANGVVTAVKEGSAVITASTVIPGMEASCQVTVTPRSGVDDIFGDTEGRFDIYNMQGQSIKRGATAEDVKALAPGLYIIGGKKVVIK